MKKKIFVAAVLCLFLGVMSQAAIVTLQVETPTVDSLYITQMLSSATPETNVRGEDNDEWTYLDGGRETQGQTFTILSSSTLNGIWARHVNYASWSDTFVGGNTITVRVCSVSGTALTVKSSEVATIADGESAAGSAWTSQQWIHIALDTPVSLSPGTYAFDLTGDTATIEIAGVNTNPYSGGNAYTTADNQRLGTDMTRPHSLGDRTFILELEPGDTAPHGPQAIPQNLDGSVGTLDGLTVHNVDLTFKAGTDPNYPVDGSIVHSDTAGFVIRLQTGAPTDPNLYIVGTMEAGSMEDPDRTFLLSASGYGVLNHSTTYQWQVEQVLDDPNEENPPYPPGDPHNISGGVWSFTTISAVPSITTNPAHTLTDASGNNATLTVVASAVANAYRWFKEAGETDIKLTDGEIAGVVYSGTQTVTLTIGGMADDGSEDAQYYAIAYNGEPEGAGLASAPSATAWVWYPREVHRYTFEGTYADGGNSFVEDTIGISDIQLISDDGGPDLASIVSDNPAAPGLVGTQSLYLNNPNIKDPNNNSGQYGRINDPMVVAYADITISTWVYHKGGGWQRILGFGNNNGSGTGPADNKYLYLTPSANAVSGMLRLEVHGQNVTAPAGSVPENEWAYVTATLSGSTAKLFVNGVWVATNANLTADPIADVPMANNCIGRCQWYAWDSLFNGYIADLRIWNYGLSTDEVGQAYLSDNTNAAYVCDIEGYNLPYDLNENCEVDLDDLKLFAATWLDSYRIYPD